MIQDVSLSHSTWAELPHKFEAGTPAIGEAIGMSAALSYLQGIGFEAIQTWETELTRHLFKRLQSINQLSVLGPTPEQDQNRGALASFLAISAIGTRVSMVKELEVQIRSNPAS